MNIITTDHVASRAGKLSPAAFAVAPLIAVAFAIATPLVVPDSPVAPEEAVMHLPLTAMFGFAYGYGMMLVAGVPAAAVLCRLTEYFGPAYVMAGLLAGLTAGLLSGWGAQMVAWGCAAGGATALGFLALNVGMAADSDRPDT